ncbi:MAG: hypothetical protein ACR2RB_22315 [Gammaproteobacteria bacterium]
MKPESSTRRIGFRHWYERQLWESFAWLVTGLLSGIAIATILEVVGLRTTGLTPLVTLATVYVVGLLAVDAFRRFFKILSHAQHCAGAATCARCGAYGLFEVVIERGPIPAKCRKCEYRWTIE